MSCGWSVWLLCSSAMFSLIKRKTVHQRTVHLHSRGWKTDFWQYSPDSYVINEAFFLKTDLTIREYCYVKQDVD